MSKRMIMYFIIQDVGTELNAMLASELVAFVFMI